VFGVNWFRRGADNKFMWPGYSDNMRVLKWIFERVNGRASGKRHSLGVSPQQSDFDWSGLESYPAADFAALTAISAPEWIEELKTHREFLAKFGDRLPMPLMAYNESLMKRLGDSLTATGNSAAVGATGPQPSL
jgi:phosphoenolpyruvate carboxykinase (GTP)